MTNRFAAAIALLLVFFPLSCTHTAGPLAGKDPYPVDISALCNRTYQSPWANQPPYGYREWFGENPFIHENIPFLLDPGGGVISLRPQQSVTMTFDAPLRAKGIAMLCAANFLYEDTLTFYAVLDTESGQQTIALTAHEWYEPLDPIEGPRPHTAALFEAYVDNQTTAGQVGITRANFAAGVRGFRIVNPSQSNMQHLMIAAVTLL